MKRIGSISCICSIVLLSSCTSTRQQEALSSEDIVAQKHAFIELESALEQEEVRLMQEALAAKKARAEEEARLEAKEKAREEAERKAEEEEAARLAAEEKAAEEAEQKAQAREAEEAWDEKPAATPGLLTSRGRRRPANTAEENITPTAAQQEAARAMLSKTAEPRTKVAEAPVTAEPKKKENKQQEKQPEEPQEEMQLPGSVRNGVLRTRRFAPPEEAISSKDNDEPMPNSVEMRGFRSPVMKANLPMNLDGKIIKND